MENPKHQTDSPAERRHLRLVVGPPVPLHRRRYADMIRATEMLLDDMRAGKIKGFLWAAKYDTNDHETGATGDYTTNLMSGIGAAMALLDELHLRRK